MIHTLDAQTTSYLSHAAPLLEFLPCDLCRPIYKNVEFILLAVFCSTVPNRGMDMHLDVYLCLWVQGSFL